MLPVRAMPRTYGVGVIPTYREALSLKEHDLLKPKSDRAMIPAQLCPVLTLKKVTRKPSVFFHFFFLPGIISGAFAGYKL